MCLGEIGHVTSVDAVMGCATVDVAGRARQASLLLYPEAAPGDHVVVHSGFVVQVIGTAEAASAHRVRAGQEGQDG